MVNLAWASSFLLVFVFNALMLTLFVKSLRASSSSATATRLPLQPQILFALQIFVNKELKHHFKFYHYYCCYCHGHLNKMKWSHFSRWTLIKINCAICGEPLQAKMTNILVLSRRLQPYLLQLNSCKVVDCFIFELTVMTSITRRLDVELNWDWN